MTNIKKKSILIFTVFILLIISAIIAIILLYFQGKEEELITSKSNILYYSESKNNMEGEDNKVLLVGLKDKKDKNNQSVDIKNAPYYIKVNNEANVVTVYKKDTVGEYTVPIKAMICSIGTATPESGVYDISDKYVWRELEGNVYGQYACRITGHILFHSVPYEKEEKSTLEWWEYDKLGSKASLGCVRLKVEDAKWIYDNCIPGTKVEFYSSKEPGPLGKPQAMKISDEEAVRNWDPTDPDENNPWNNK